MNGKIRAINNITGYIEENLSKPLTVSEVADALHYSKYYLHRLFSQTTGITIHEYIHRRQLTKGAKILASSQTPIIEVAYQAGYETQQAFTTAFKAMYKQTPGRFRKRGEYYPLQLEFHFEGCSYGTGLIHPVPFQVKPATVEMIPQWMTLVDMIVDGFPYLNRNDYITELKTYITKGHAFIMAAGADIITGIMLVNGRAGVIDFMGIHPFYKNSDAGSLFLKAVDQIFEYNRYISITTYREGDKADTGYRRAIKRLGFQEGELLTEYGYPTQRFFLDRGEGAVRQADRI